MKINANSKIIKSKNALVQELDREAVLLNLDNNQYYRLDEDSLRMFNVLVTSVNLGESRTALATEFDVPVEKLWVDLVKFVEELEKSGLVQVLDE